MRVSANVLKINPGRMQADFDSLALIGETAEGGVHRPALSVNHLRARAWFRKQVEAAGLEFKLDGAGNHSAFLDCGPAGGASLLLGSHLDSVPHGGCFDGALGVVAALEVLRVIKENNLSLPVNLEAIDFTDEEGTLVGLLGSSALAGTLRYEVLQNPRGGRKALLEGFGRASLSEESVLSAKRDPNSIAGYLELHIEQGPRLIQAATQVGVVTGIAGIASYELTFIGRADHAGTTPMDSRLDAAQGASAFVLAVREIVRHQFPTCVANVGSIHFQPGAFNIVPENVFVALEFRAPQADTLANLGSILLGQAKEESMRFGLGLEIKLRGLHPAIPMNPLAQDAIISACNQLELTHLNLPSMAGHDAQSMAHICPAGMIFVPSVGGASHSAREFTERSACLDGANVLLNATLHMAASIFQRSD